jgi:glycosyltransferase involved in cell wall biosynthesis
MILGVNGIRLVVQRAGVARAIEAILRCLDQLPHPFDDVRVYTPIPLPSDVVLPRGGTNVVLPSGLPYGLWEQIVLPRGHGKKGLLLCPSSVVPLFARSAVFLIHHGAAEGFPDAYDWWGWQKTRTINALSAWRADGISTVSQSTRRDMARFYWTDPARIHVVPEGVDTKLFRPLADKQPLAAFRRSVLGADVPFLVYVGKPTERRNITPLVQAFGELKHERGLPHRLLIVGGDLPGTSPFRRTIDELGLTNEVAVLGYATYEQMVTVYNAADALVYPSSYEGFGMPVLEAMACGTPAIALDNTALPEFAAGVALLLKDASVETLKEGISRVLSDSAMRERMAAEGPARAAQYDWRLVTERYLDLMIPLVMRNRDAGS